MCSSSQARVKSNEADSFVDLFIYLFLLLPDLVVPPSAVKKTFFSAAGAMTRRSNFRDQLSDAPEFGLSVRMAVARAPITSYPALRAEREVEGRKNINISATKSSLRAACVRLAVFKKNNNNASASGQ